MNHCTIEASECSSLKSLIRAGALMEYNVEHDLLSFTLKGDRLLFLGNFTLMHVSGVVIDFCLQRMFLCECRKAWEAEHLKAWEIYTTGIVGLGQALINDDERFLDCCRDSLAAGLLGEGTMIAMVVETILRLEKMNYDVHGNKFSRKAILTSCMLEPQLFTVAYELIRKACPDY